MAKKTTAYTGEDELTLAVDEAIRVCREILARCWKEQIEKQQ